MTFFVGMIIRRRMVSVIGDAGLSESDMRYGLAKDLGKELVSNGYRLITGGLGGCMKAVCKGAKESPKYMEGDIVGVLPGYDPSEANEFVDVPIATGIFHARNAIVANSDAVIAIGGGSGTLSEMAMAWIMQRLLIAFKVEGWSGKLADQRTGCMEWKRLMRRSTYSSYFHSMTAMDSNPSSSRGCSVKFLRKALLSKSFMILWQSQPLY